MSAPDLLAAALEYAERGWPVLPLHSIGPDGRCTCGSKPDGKGGYVRPNGKACRPGKHPRTMHGKDDATTDPEQIRLWWNSWPDANIGVANGMPF